MLAGEAVVSDTQRVRRTRRGRAIGFPCAYVLIIAQIIYGRRALLVIYRFLFFYRKSIQMKSHRVLIPGVLIQVSQRIAWHAANFADRQVLLRGDRAAARVSARDHAGFGGKFKFKFKPHSSTWTPSARRRP